MGQIRGSYPGGPRREGAEGEPAAASPRPRLRRVEEIEARLGRASRAREQRRRARRVWSGLVVAVAISGVVGLFLGYRSHRSSEELTAERNAPRPAGAFDPSFETNRVLLELWQMEDKQRMQAKQP
jgi:hypothetical protein